MRDCSPQLAARLEVESTSLARLWRVTRSDGVVLRFTDSVRDIRITIDPDVTPQVYRSDISFTASAIFTSRSFANQQSVTMTLLMDDAGFKESDMRQRLYDGAVSEIFIVDYAFPQYGTVTMFVGVFGQIQLSNLPVATVEVLPSQSTLNGVGIGTDKFSQTCRANLGDTKCKVDLDALKFAFTVDTASGGSFVSSDLIQDNAHWALGFVKWLTGNNIGKTSGVQSNDAGTTSVFLLSPPFFAIEAGDTGYIYPGCDKLRQTCFDVYDNVLNMRAEPDVPNGAGIPGSNYSINTNIPMA